MAKDKPRNIACLETLWHGDISRPYTVRGILQTASDLARFRFAHLTCNTARELEHNLHIIRRRRSYAVLYLAFHGAPGLIALDGDELSLEQLADAMGTGFKGRVVHFGSCGTIKVDAERMATFLERTGVAMVIGYQNNIDWVESASLDLLLFQWLQRYVRLNSLWTAFEKRYSGLVRLTGMSAVVA